MEEGIWFIQKFTDEMILQYKIKKTLFSGKTSFQKVDILDVAILGKTLFLDKKIQSAEIDEFVYHEALVHPAMMAHPNPKKVLILGGGEGATLREIFRYKTVQKATMVDIDEELVKLCAEYLPEWSMGTFENPNTELVFDDARKFVENNKEEFDVIISDLTEPVEEGPSIYLFTREFYSKLFNILSEDGVLVVQSGSTDPYYNLFFCSIYKTLKEVFPNVHPYWTFVFSFNIPWGFNLAFKGDSKLNIEEKELKERIDQKKFGNLKFYNSNLNNAFFALPIYLKEAFLKGRVLTDSNPFIWEV